MKASELRPGQFFEWNGERCLFIGIDTGSVGKVFYNYAHWEDDMLSQNHESDDFEVTPLNVHGWDDEPQSEPVPTVQGEWPANCLQRAFVEGAKWWEYQCESATMWQSDRNLAEEEAVRRYGEPEPVKAAPLQLREGDFVECIDRGGCVGLKYRTVYKIERFDKAGDVKLVGLDGFYMRSRFQKTTPTWQCFLCECNYVTSRDAVCDECNKESAEVPPPADQKLDALLSGKPWPPSCPNKLGSANCPTLCEPCKNAVSIEDLGNGYLIKHDTLRKSQQWTALGPHGRITDCESREDALARITAKLRESLPAKEVPPPVEPQPDADGWIAWTGGQCPVHALDAVEVRLRRFGEHAGRAARWSWNWRPNHDGYDIVAYRLVKPAPITLKTSDEHIKDHACKLASSITRSLDRFALVLSACGVEVVTR